MDADPTLPPAPPAVALVLLDVAIYRSQKKSKNRSLRSIDRAIGNGEEEIREDSKERGRGNSPEIAAGSPPCNLPAGGGSSPATASGSARAGGRLVRL